MFFEVGDKTTKGTITSIDKISRGWCIEAEIKTDQDQTMRPQDTFLTEVAYGKTYRGSMYANRNQDFTLYRIEPLSDYNIYTNYYSSDNQSLLAHFEIHRNLNRITEEEFTNGLLELEKYKDYVYCDISGERILKKDAELINDQRHIYISREIFENEDYIECYDCGRYYPKYDMEEGIDGELRCDDCHWDIHRTCDNCGGTYFCDDMFYDDYDGCLYCSDCYNHDRAILGYHPDIELVFYGKEKDKVFKGYGIELEVDSGQRQDDLDEIALGVKADLDNHIYCSYDGSLDDGFEIVTHPHTYEEMLKLDWKTALENLVNNGMLSHNAGTCGLHIHISRECFGDNENARQLAMSKLVYMFSKYENNLRKLSRRSAGSIDNWASFEKVKDQKEARKKSKTSSERGALNFNNSNTVEVRLFRGTLNLSSFLATFNLVHLFVENSKKLSWKNCEKWENWLKGADKETLEYVKGRNVTSE